MCAYPPGFFVLICLHYTSEKPTIPSMKKKKTILFAAIITVVLVGVLIWFMQRKAEAPKQHTAAKAEQQKTQTLQTTTPTANPAPAFDKQQYSLDNPASIWVVANKKRPLQPTSYAPDDLVVPNVPLRGNITGNEKFMRKEAAAALEALVAAATTQGLRFNLQSGYRSYGFQSSLYNRYVQQQGQAVADTQSARPGHSEHQTGLAVDVGNAGNPECAVEQCFANTSEGKWLAENAYTYGFIIRYPQGKDAVTGYIYEPWHLRYVGTALANEMHATGSTTIEEFFGLPAAGSY